ncbi:hypothetical protein LJR027_003657 [Terrabacter sp. LjRoot27]|uniref:hypothetical protein n=1 Tax=Terrabacter sp. LjRoot27 TaxID=3342306 RepID=UPI003ECFA7F7
MSTLQQHPQTSSPHPARGPVSPWALGLGIGGLLVAAATFVVPNPDAAGVCWTAGFALLFAALVVVVVGVVHARGDRLSVLPTSTAGWVALTCFVAGAALIFTPLAEISLALGLFAAAAGVSAVSISRERSLPVIMLPLLGGTFVLAFLLGELLIGHE